MNRDDFRKLADLRIKEAQVLLDNDCYEAAYYLAGYAVECALKACIAKKTRRFDFPDKELANKVFTHNLEILVKHAGLENDLRARAQSNNQFEDNWKVVKDWSEGSRYWISVAKQTALDIHTAIADRKNGVLSWLKKYW
jgi:HEPN domain-containing protein